MVEIKVTGKERIAEMQQKMTAAGIRYDVTFHVDEKDEHEVSKMRWGAYKARRKENDSEMSEEPCDPGDAG